MRDPNCLRRQLVLLTALASRHTGLTVKEIAGESGVTARTVLRDLARFREAGVPLEEVVGEYGRKFWRVRGARDRPPLAFNYDEAIALYLGRRMLEPLAGTPFGDAAEQAFRKVRAVLGPGALAYLERFAEIFHETGRGRHGYESKADLVEVLRLASEDRRVVRILYRSEAAVGAAPRDIHPYGVVLHGGALYLVALDPTQDRIKHFKVDRVEGAELVDGSFEPPEGFDLAVHMGQAFGVYRGGDPVDVEVRFAPSVARYVRESRRHETQRLTEQPDGGLLARYTVSGTEELKRWILGFGAKAEILAPDSLRSEVVAELLSTLIGYGCVNGS